MLRLDTALKSGNVGFVIYLHGTARVSPAVKATVSRRIGNHLRAYLRTKFSMTVAEARKVVANVTVDVQKI